MEGSREVRLSLETVLKRSWPLVAFGAVLFFAVIAGLVWFAVSGAGRKAPTPDTQPPTSEIATTTGDLISRALDGILVTPAEARLQPYAVVVENHTDARPLAGPASANLVFEIPVEGGITRYLLIFDATTTVDAIGPVRSARPYFVDFADGLNAVYAHVGGSPEAIEKIKNMTGFRDLNEYWNGKYFWRTPKRAAPHNIFTRTDLLQEAAGLKKWSEGHFRGWHYKDDAPVASATSTPRGAEDGPDLKYGGSYNVSWSYDRNRNAYLRSEAGSFQKDQDGTQVEARNVAVLVTDGQVLDDEGRLKIRTTGRGKATVYRDGRAIETNWVRTAGDHLRFESTDGTDVLLNRGTTWVEVVFDGSVYGGTETATTTR